MALVGGEGEVTDAEFKGGGSASSGPVLEGKKEFVPSPVASLFKLLSSPIHCGCAAFGHTCYGGYGKRFDSTVERNSLQNSITRNIQESKVPLSNVELFYILPNDEFRERSDQSFMRTHRDTQQVNVHPLSFLVDHWSIIPPTEPIYLPSVTSLNLNLPIMTSTEAICPVDESVDESDFYTSVISTIPSFLELPITITKPASLTYPPQERRRFNP
ncbi:hypothetical protein G5I_03822 [Acromyrmex echinatior]|uniref:Uncharacterized protein n=1 Tax=Acromyrmex echinatior TaxID=103372 RepID=F4WDZ5_ACREC|nr:hypothetical protein G5I_03822 [Acromyrmex echinatior]